jgi:hypothetical protein
MAHALRSINRIICEALAAIHAVDEVNQELDIILRNNNNNVILSVVDARHFAKKFSDNILARWKGSTLYFTRFTAEAVEVFRAYLLSTSSSSHQHHQRCYPPSTWKEGVEMKRWTVAVWSTQQQ